MGLSENALERFEFQYLAGVIGNGNAFSPFVVLPMMQKDMTARLVKHFKARLSQGADNLLTSDTRHASRGMF